MTEKSKRYLKIFPIVAFLAVTTVVGVRWALGLGTEGADYAEAREAFLEKRYREAASRFESFQTSYPVSEFALSAKLYQAVSLRQATRPSGDPFLAVGEDREWADARAQAQSLLQAYRTGVAAALDQPELAAATRDRYEFERLESFLLADDLAGLTTESQTYCQNHAADLAKLTRGRLFLAIAQTKSAMQDNLAPSAAASTLAQILSTDYSQVTIEGDLSDALAKAAAWRIWAALALGDSEAAGDALVFLESLPQSDAKNSALRRYGSLL